MTRFAVLSASGIGDACILEVLSHQLRLQGHDVVTFSDHLHGFGPWLPTAVCQKQPELHLLKDTLEPFDAIIIQHDNTARARAIVEMRTHKPVHVLYTNYRYSKHGPLHPTDDFVFHERVPMVKNITHALRKLFEIHAKDADNGLSPPPGLIYRKYPKRIVIHPTSAVSSKNWPKHKFLRVASWLKKKGYEPVFVTSLEERDEWNSVELPSLSDLTSFLYESGGFLGNDSGPGHLASYLKLPHLIIGRQKRQMELWRPGWYIGAIATTPSWIPNWKGWRIRDEKWQLFISTRRVIKLLQKNVLCI